MKSMARENLKLISVRIEPDTLEKIEAFTKKKTWWKRNTVINQILTVVMNDFKDEEIYDMVRRSYFRKNEIEAHYKIVNEGKMITR